MRQGHLRRLLSLAMLVALFVYVAAGPFTVPTVSAQDGGDGSPVLSLDSATAESILGGMRTEDGRLMVMVELEAPPAVTAFLAAGGDAGGPSAVSSAMNVSAALQAEQDIFVGAASANGVSNPEVLGRTMFLINTVSLAINEADLNALASTPGVKNLMPVIEHTLDLSNAVPYTGTAAAWSLPGNYTGNGQVVAVVDSGVDYTNPTFGGTGVYPAGGPNSAPRISPVAFGTFPLPAGAPFKLVGGYDYVGDSFSGSNTPAPDPNPLDCRSTEGGGHGTHVSGISTGYGISSGSTTYAGPWDNTTPFDTMFLAPGYAPRAALLGMRVFGCSGSTSSIQVTAAMSDAVAGFVATVPSITFPRATVINMSLGSSLGYSGDDANLNPYVSAVANAMAAGTVVVMSAGNNYNTHFITGSPGSSPAGISVASVIVGRYNAITISGTTADGNYAVQQSVGSPMNAVVGPYPVALPAGNGCSAANWSAFPANRIAMVLFTGACGSNALINNAAAAPNPPRGLLIISNVAGQFQNLGCNVTTPYVPCVSIQDSTGTLITSNLATAQVTLDPSLRASASNLAGAASAFTSRGPGRQSNTTGFKPDVAATGDGIVSAASGSATYRASNSGTSMSSPSVAGMIATLRSNPAFAGWTTAQIKALVMNTATTATNVTDALGNVHPQVRFGAGVINTLSAMQNRVVAFNASRPDVVNVSFGSVQAVFGNTPTVVTRTVSVQNLSGSTATYNVGYVAASTQPGVTISVSPTSISVPAGGLAQVTVTLTANYNGIAQPHANTDPTRGNPPFLQVGLARTWLSESTGYVSLTPTSSAAGVDQPLRVPVYGSGRVASSMVAQDNLVANGLAGTANITLSGTGVNTGPTLPFDIVSAVTALRLAGEDPVGDVIYNAPWRDIQYVGIANDANGNITSSSYIYIGVAVAGDVSTTQPNPANQYFIYFDYNNDGISDHCMFNSSPINAAENNSRTDVPLTFLITAPSPAGTCGGSGSSMAYVNDFTPSSIDMYWFDNNVHVFPVSLNRMGRSNANPSFRFRVESYGEFALMDSFPNSGWIDYNPNQPVLSFNSAGEIDGTPTFMPTYVDSPATTIPVQYDLTTFTGVETPAILLLHHHNNNITAPRAEVVRFGVTGVTATGISLTHSVQATAGLNSLVPFTLTVTNASATVAANNVVVTQELPPATVASIASLPANCTAANQVVTCTVGTLAPSASQTLVITVNALQLGTMTAIASATTTSQDLNPTDNTDIPATVTVGEPVFGPGPGGTGGTGTGPTTLPATGYEPAPDAASLAYVFGVVLGLLLLCGALILRRRR